MTRLFIQASLVNAQLKLVNEMYFAILLDRKTAGPVMIGCSEGGTSIEDLAEKFPDKIIKLPLDVRTPLTDAQALQMAEGLKVTTGVKAAAEQIKALYKLFVERDCTMVEVCGSCLVDYDRPACLLNMQIS